MIDRRGYRPLRSRTILDEHQTRQSRPTIGLVAGWGSFPVEVAEALIRSGHPVCCVAIKGHATASLESICDHVVWMGVGKIGGHLRYFRRNRVRHVTMAGKLFKADILYSGSVWLQHFPDLTCLRTFGPSLLGRKRDARDDNLLGAVTRTYTRSGIEVCAATDFAPELLVTSGTLTGTTPSTRLQNDIEAGWSVAKQMGGLDIGQTITIKDGTVIAVEAIEGTDACIERTGALCRRGGWTLIKVSKPNQDMRFDVPTIGPQTIAKVHAAGGTAIVIEADKTIVVEREKTIADAKAAGITLVAINANSMGMGASVSVRRAA